MLETDGLRVREEAGHFPTIPCTRAPPIRDANISGLERLIRELVNRLKCGTCCKMGSLMGVF